MPEPTKDFAELERTLKVTFKDPQLLRQALVHRSYLNENPKFELDHNERLEFLGDAVMELVVTEHLYRTYPDNPEGDLTNWRSALVNSRMIAQVARRLGFEDFLFLSRGEAKDTGRARDYILGNAFEAVTGAIYLDQGFSAAKTFVERELVKELPFILKNELYLDPKSKLQEKAQETEHVTPQYKVLESFGPDHDKRFKVGVYLGRELAGVGEGTSKQNAQLDAALDALKKRQWN
ncbi:MAG: ribonuclease III [Parcubacteria group bacterium]